MTYLSRTALIASAVAVLAIPANAAAQTKSDTITVLTAITNSFPTESKGKKVGLSSLMAPAEGQPPKQLVAAEKEMQRRLILDVAKGRFVIVDEAGTDAESRKQWFRELRNLGRHYALGPLFFDDNRATAVVYEGSAFEGAGLQKLGLNVWNYFLEKRNGAWSVVSKELVHSTTFTPDQ